MLNTIRSWGALGVSIAFAVAVCAARGDELEAEAIRTVRKLGATFERDEAVAGAPGVAISFNFNRVPDGVARHLIGFGRLHMLDFSGTYISDEDLKALSRLQELRILTFANCNLRRSSI